VTAVEDTQVIDEKGSRFERIPITSVLPDPNQPRKIFDAAKLQELARSIHEIGQIEPVEVRPIAGTPSYMLVAGERRWRAITLLADGKVKGIDPNPSLTIEAIVKEGQSDLASALRQMVENLQREDLDPIEEARGIARLVSDEFGLKGKDVAEKIGRNAGHVTKRLKLLELPPEGQKMVSAGTLSIDAALEYVKEANGDAALIAEALAGKNPHNIGWAIQNARRMRKNNEAVTKIKALAKAKGAKVTELVQKSWDAPKFPKGWVEVSTEKYRAGSAGVIVLPDAAAHRREDCWAVVLLDNQYHNNGVTITECCTDPSRHAAKGESTLKAAKSERTATGGKLSPKDKADRSKTIRSNKARREDRPRRDDFVTAKLDGRVLPMAVPAILWAFIRTYFASDASYRRKTLDMAMRSFGYELGQGQMYSGSQIPAELLAYLQESDANLTRFAFAIVLANDESYEHQHAPKKDGVLRDALTEWGYEFSEQEREDFGLPKSGPIVPPAKKAPVKKAAAKKVAASKVEAPTSESRLPDPPDQDGPELDDEGADDGENGLGEDDE
jgi:ParB/RepB/Spo0J family partition protein